MEFNVDQALEQGVAAHKEGKLQDAEDLYRAILQAQPKHPDANHNLGSLAVAVGKPLEAIPLFKLALEANPQIEQFWLSYADALIKVEHIDEANHVLVEAEKSGVASEKLYAAQQRLKEYVSNDMNRTAKNQTLSEKRKKLAKKKKSKKRKAPNSSSNAAPSPDQLNHLLEQYQARRLVEAEELATSLTQQFPRHPFGWKVLGVVLRQRSRLSESLVPMQSVVMLSPRDAEAHNNLGATLQELGRLDEAEASYKKAIALKPDYVGAHYNLGNTRKELGGLDEAEASYKRAIALKPDYAEAHNNLGNTLRELGRLDESGASYRQAIALKPDYADAHYNLGVTLEELGRLDEAGASYKKAIAMQPDYAEAHYNLGNTLKELGGLNEAEASYTKAIALKPHYPETHNNLGVTLQGLGSLDEAETSYKKAIDLRPDYAEAHYNLGVTLQELGRLDEAEASYKKAIALKPDYAGAYNNLGNTLRELGSLDEAETSYKKVIALKPDYAEAHNNLGATLRELGRLDESEASYRQATALKPDYAEAHSNLGNALRELGRLEESEVSYRQAAVLNPEDSSAKHFLAALSGNTTSAAPLDYVEGLFDDYASKFERSLVGNLEYKIPKLIAEIILRDCNSDSLGSIIDLGCGTGLLGVEIKQVCKHLEGLDLSRKMLDEAKKKGVYDELIKKDILGYLATADLNFDYFIATDVFIYVGDLSGVFHLIKSRNETGGKLVFSTEHCGGDDFLLEQSGRYSHSKMYIEGLCEKFGYKLRHFEIQPLRKEKNQYITGGLYILDF